MIVGISLQSVVDLTRASFRYKKRIFVLFYEVVECPEVVFFLDYDVFEHASCCCVAAFECFSDDLAVQ